MTLTIATKLRLSDIKNWAEAELSGYPENSSIPPYRIIGGIVKYLNPVRGWSPVTFESPEDHNNCSSRTLSQPIGELEDLVSRTDQNEALVMYFPPKLEHNLQEALGVRNKLALFISASQIKGIIEIVRNQILQHALKLEELGILGENMTFSNEEKQRGMEEKANIQYNTYNTTIGSLPPSSPIAPIAQSSNR